MWAGSYETLGIPKFSTNVRESIQFGIDSGLGNTGTSNAFTIIGEAIDNSALFNSGIFNITSRDRTIASVAWVIPYGPPVIDEKRDTPDIAAVIQEIVNRAGWSDNNMLTLMVYPDVYLALPDPTTGGTTTVQEIEFEAGPGTDSATLTVEFLIPPSSVDDWRDI